MRAGTRLFKSAGLSHRQVARRFGTPDVELACDLARLLDCPAQVFCPGSRTFGEEYLASLNDRGSAGPGADRALADGSEAARIETTEADGSRPARRTQLAVAAPTAPRVSTGRPGLRLLSFPDAEAAHVSPDRPQSRAE
jgi:hypothetical protein